MVAAFMQLELHGWGNHAVWVGAGVADVRSWWSRRLTAGSNGGLVWSCVVVGTCVAGGSGV